MPTLKKIGKSAAKKYDVKKMKPLKKITKTVKAKSESLVDKMKLKVSSTPDASKKNYNPQKAGGANPQIASGKIYNPQY